MPYKCKEKRNAAARKSMRKWRLNNKDRQREINTEYYANNKESVRQQQSEYAKKKRRTLFLNAASRISGIQRAAKRHGYSPITDSKARVMAYMATQTECCHCGADKDLCVDHCHTTGKVRGMLCRTCNTNDVLK